MSARARLFAHTCVRLYTLTRGRRHSYTRMTVRLSVKGWSAGRMIDTGAYSSLTTSPCTSSGGRAQAQRPRACMAAHRHANPRSADRWARCLLLGQEMRNTRHYNLAKTISCQKKSSGCVKSTNIDVRPCSKYR